MRRSILFILLDEINKYITYTTKRCTHNKYIYNNEKRDENAYTQENRFSFAANNKCSRETESKINIRWKNADENNARQI